MKAEDIRARLLKAEENVSKRIKTTERFTQQLIKAQAKLQRCGWIDLNDLDSIAHDSDARARYTAETGDDLYWDICEVKWKENDIKDSNRKLKDLQQIVENWKEKLSKAEAVEDIWNGVIPQSFKSYKDRLVAEWNAWDKERRANLTREYKKLGYRDFMKRYKYAEYEFLSKTDDEIDKENQRDAENLILDLYNRVVNYIGKITSWEQLCISQYHINGIISGELGDCKVESILAGGYNIQRLHIRVLVHKIDFQQEAKESVKAEKTISKATKTPKSNSEYSQMTISELEGLLAELGGTCKVYENERIYRMRLVMAVKKMKEGGK
jgi:hypothetical protein